MNGGQGGRPEVAVEGEAGGWGGAGATHWQ